MGSPKIVAAIVLAVAPGLLAMPGRAAAQAPGAVMFDPATGQYLSFTPDQGATPQDFSEGGAAAPGYGLTAEPPLGSDDGSGPCDPLDPSWWGPAWIRRFSLFAGVHGFRGPIDLDRAGNFGFHEGLNYGAPVGGPFGFGYQLGFEVTHSNFNSEQIVQGGDPRTQFFFTGGLFHRSMGFGLQSGMAVDYFHDEYYAQSDLIQLRSETALRLGPRREIGYFGAYKITDDMIHVPGRLDQLLRPEDLFGLFYRRHFSGGGQGRAWAGVSGDGDVFFGAEATVPLGTNWALENNYGYLLPRHPTGPDGDNREVWSVSIQLVWYPGRPAKCVFRDPFQPVLNVADNSVFMVRR